MASKNAGLPIKVEFGGGLELLFSNERKHSVTLPATYDPAQVDAYETGGVPREGNSEADMRFLIWYLRHQVLADKSRPELFTQRDTVYVRSSSLSRPAADIRPLWHSTGALVFLCSSTLPTGSSRASSSTRCSQTTRFSSSRPCMAAEASQERSISSSRKLLVS